MRYLSNLRYAISDLINNTQLSTLYNSQINNVDIGVIAKLLITNLSIVFWVYTLSGPIKYVPRLSIWFFYMWHPAINSIISTAGSLIWSLYQSPPELWPFWLFPAVGLYGLNDNEARQRIDKIIKYLRVSSDSQKDQYGKDRQNRFINDELEELGIEDQFTISDDWESASTMLRGNMEEILDIVSGDEESTYCMMIGKVDRLSRAPPFEACTFFWLSKEYNVLFYFAGLGYFDFSEPTQQLRVFFELYQSRNEYLKISERTSEGQRSVKENGGVPGPAPYGYQKQDGTNIIQICDPEAKVIQDGVATLLETDASVASVWRDLKEKYNDEDIELPSYPAFLDILRRKKYTGILVHEGEPVGECPEIITEETFERLQQHLGERSRDEHDEEVEPILKSVIERFGLEPSLDLFDVIKGRCPDCGGDVKPFGSTDRWGHRVRQYECEEVDCTFTGPLLSAEVLRRWDNNLPILCPVCQTPADDGDWEKCHTKIEAIEQSCSECGTEFTIDFSEELMNGYERGFELPEYAIDWFEDKNNSDSGDSTDSPDRGNGGTSEDGNDTQRDLGSFGCS